MSLKQDALDYHSEGRAGKIEIIPTKTLLTQRDLSLAYTPGVAEPCLAIHRNPDDAYLYTAKGNLVAVVTNGTAVLGLGNIGPLAGKPVMEGKSNLFKKFADIDAVDIELDATTPEEVIAAVKAIAPSFGGINLEDIRSPDCFLIERRLQTLDIPVFHDDQHGTAIIAAAGLLNACEITDRKLDSIRVVFSGAGAAAIAVANLIVSLGVRVENIWMCDSEGLVYHGRKEQNFPEKRIYSQGDSPGTLQDVLPGADVLIGLSVGGVVTGEMLRTMAPRPIVFAMANPNPEITYDDARAAVPDAIIATGRSDYPNQVNNVLGFPFLFRGALDCRARAINEDMKVAAVRALAALTRADVPDSVLSAYNLTSLHFGPDYIIPKPFDPRVLLWVAPAVAQAAAASGVARVPIADLDAYRERLERLTERSKEVLRPMMNRARLRGPRRIVLSDGTNPKVLRAAQILVDEKICKPILIGEEWKILKRAADHKVDLHGIDLIDIRDDERFEHYAVRLWELRQRKGMTTASARAALRAPVRYGLMMVREGDADGLIGGLMTSYAETMRPALQILGRDPKVKVASGAYMMLFKNRRLFFGDCTVNTRPDATALAQIAINTARLAASFGYPPRVAMLAYGDFGEHRDDPNTLRIQEAIRIVRAEWPELVIDGEMQADTAVNPDRTQADFPFSAIQGDANVLVFPDLASGNIAYKLLRELGGATAVGPILTGLHKPVNALALGSTVNDIVHMAAITANQAHEREARLATPERSDG